MDNPIDIVEEGSRSTETTTIEPEPTVNSKHDFIVIPRATLNNVFIAVVFFALGAFIAFSLITQSASAHRAEHDQLINQAVTVALAARPEVAPSNAAGAGRRLEVSVDDDPFWGPSDAPVTIVEFSDFQCPFCGRFHQSTYAKLKETYGDRIRFVYRDFPLLDLHPNALMSAEAANCANDQGKYWEYHDLLLTNQDQSDRVALGNFAEQLQLDMATFNECLDSGRYRDEVKADASEASEYGVQGTPTFFINGRPVIGAQPYQTFAAMIDEELAANP